MSNIQNIHKDIVWLSWLLYYRWDFFQCERYENVRLFFANCKQQTEEERQKFFYRPVQFSIVKPTLEVQAQAFANRAHNRDYATFGGVPVFVGDSEDDLPNLEPLKEATHVMLAKEPFTLLEIQGQWAKVNGYFYQRETSDSDKYGWRGYVCWVLLKHTNIPVHYYPDFTWDDFNVFSAEWNDDQKALIKEDLQNKDRVAYWENFYNEQDLSKVKPPELTLENSPYAQFIQQYQLGFEDRFLLILSLVNQVKPDFLLRLIPKAKDFPDLGGATGQNFKGFLPTGDTYIFLMAGRDIFKRQEILEFFVQKSVLVQEGFVSMVGALPGEPPLSGILALHPEQIPVVLNLELNQITIKSLN